MTFVAERAARTHSFTLDRPAREAFRLFEPEGERAWAEGWDPQYVYPREGRAEAGMVFTTSHNAESTIWVMTRHEPEAGVVQYVRTTPGSRVATVTVQCAPLSEARTRVTVIYVFTALNEAGNAYVRDMDERHYRDFVDGWERAIRNSPSAGSPR